MSYKRETSLSSIIWTRIKYFISQLLNSCFIINYLHLLKKANTYYCHSLIFYVLKSRHFWVKYCSFSNTNLGFFIRGGEGGTTLLYFLNKNHKSNTFLEELKKCFYFSLNWKIYIWNDNFCFKRNHFCLKMTICVKKMTIFV